MIFYLIKASDAKMAYVTSWGPVPGGRMRFLRYEALPDATFLPGTYIFADLETLLPAQMTVATAVAEQLLRAGGPVRVLNHPARVLRRYDLLRTLYASGINRFRARRIAEGPHSLRFPVFVRREDEHTASLTPLLHTRAALDRTLTLLRLKGHRLTDLLVVEFCHTADERGVFRKYSALNVGGRILPRHLIFSRDWIVKRPDLAGDQFVREQRAYLEANPHERWLSDVFKLAGIDFGRIDYSLLHGEPQVWEINTQATVQKITVRLTAAFEEIDCVPDGMNPIPVVLDPAAIAAMRREAVWETCDRAVRGIVPWLSDRSALQPITRIAKAAVLRDKG